MLSTQVFFSILFVFIAVIVVLFVITCIEMSKVGGLQFSRPVFDWESKDKLTELSQFKADCEILFTGPLCDLKEKQRAGLLINWLGRQATQIIASSTDNNVDSPEAVFETLEKVFRPESNQTLSRFKFRNMKQTSAQSCDSYMSQLRLSLPECRYRNDSDELLKDQFIFGLYNKEIQDHLLGEISEADNSVKALYEARRIESKLAQRKMLGIVTPTAISVEAIHRGFRNKSKSKSKGFKSQADYTDCRFCGKAHDKGQCPAYGKICNKCGRKNHFESKCQAKAKSDRQKDSKSRKCGKCGHNKKSTVQNTVKKNLVSQTQTQVELKI